MALALNYTTRVIVSAFARGATPVLATLSPVADAAAGLLSLPSASASFDCLRTCSLLLNCAESPTVKSSTMTTLRPPPPRKRKGPPCPPTRGKLRADGREQPSCSYDVDAEDPTCHPQVHPTCHPQVQLPVATASPCHQLQQQPPAKSAKRQAAEALLAARFGVCLRIESPSSTTTTTTTTTTNISAGLLTSCPFASRARVAVGTGRGTVPQHLGLPSARCHLLCTAAGSDDSSTTDLTSPPHGDGAVGPCSTNLAAAAHRPPQLSHHANWGATAAATDPTAGRLSSVQPQPLLHQVQVQAPPARVSLSAATAQSLGLGGRHRVGSAPEQPQPRPATIVPPCDPDRGCSREGCTAQEIVQTAEGSVPGPSGASGFGTGSAAAAAAGTGTGSRGATAAGSRAWCNFEVRVPPVNWQTVLDEPPGALQRFSLALGYEKLQLPEGLVTYVVESSRHVDDALRKLRAGMQDPVIAIDLEWRPETVSGRRSPVAMMQLSSATVCVALRVSSMGYVLPDEVFQFLSEPSTVLLGFSWEGADEAKMRGTFGIGRGNFRRFLDLQEVATCLGYPRHLGLARLAEVVLGTPLHKSKSVTRSNWAAPRLTNHQLKYASLDVLVAGQLFRALRLWHSSPSPCAVCRHPIGELMSLGRILCGDLTCKANSADLQSHLNHCAKTGHKPRFGTCGACGRTQELPRAAAAMEATAGPVEG